MNMLFNVNLRKSTDNTMVSLGIVAPDIITAIQKAQASVTNGATPPVVIPTVAMNAMFNGNVDVE